MAGIPLDPGLALQLLIYGLTNGAIVALNACGFTLAYAVARQINLAHGNVFALATVLVASFAGWLGLTAAAPLWQRLLGLLVLVAVGAACGGLLNAGVERLAFRPFRGRPRALGPLIATVGLSFFLLQSAIWWRVLFPSPAKGQSIFLHLSDVLPYLSMPDIVPPVELLGGGVSLTLKDLLVLLLAGGVALGLTAFLQGTRSGRLLRAVAQDPELVSLSGGDPDRAQLLAFGLAGGLAGFAAAIFAAYYGAGSGQFGLRAGLAAMTAAVLGGVGNPRGALLAGVLIGVFSSFSDYLLDPQWTPVLVLVVLIALLACRPHGVLAPSLVAHDSREETSPPPTLADPGRPGQGRLLLVILAVALAYPALDGLARWGQLTTVSAMLLLVSLAVGLSIVVGFAGLLDLGYAAFFAIGGYTVGLLASPSSRLGLLLPAWAHEPWLALPLAGLVSAGFGLVFGVPSIRTRGEYLAIVTLAFGEIVPGVIWHLPYWTGGNNGLSGVPLPGLGPALDRLPPLHGYVLALGLAVLACVAALHLARSRLGRAWAAVRDDETAAEASGISVPGAKLLAFAVGAGGAGLAGAVFAGLVSYIEPAQFDLTVSLMVLASVVIGGRWGVPGVVVGALVVAAYDRVLADTASMVVRGLGAATGLGWLAGVEVRATNFALFGVALYLAVLLRGTRTPETRASG